MKLKFSLANGWSYAVVAVVLFGLLELLRSVGLLGAYATTIMILIAIAIILSSSLSIITGFMGQLALGHAGFMAIGAYAAALFAKWLVPLNVMPREIVFILALLIAMAVALLFGIVIAIPTMRLKGDYLGIVTLGFGEIIRVVINNLSFTGGGMGLTAIPRLVSFEWAYWIMVLVVAVIALVMTSRFGRTILTIREDEVAAEAIGIHTMKTKIIAFGLAAMIGGLGGGLYAFQITYLAPTAFSFLKSVEIFVVVVLGGMGSLSGTVIAAVILTILPEVLRQFSSYRYLVYALVLILMMLYRPQGIMGIHEISIPALWTKWKAKLLNRKKVKS